MGRPLHDSEKKAEGQSVRFSFIFQISDASEV